MKYKKEIENAIEQFHYWVWPVGVSLSLACVTYRELDRSERIEQIFFTISAAMNEPL